MKHAIWTAVVLSAGMVACSSTPVAPAPVVARPAASPPAATPAPAPSAQPGSVVRTEPTSQPLDPLKDPRSMLAKRSVYFEFDSSLIRPDFNPLLIAHGEFLAKSADRHVRIEGNADERGSHEYNLSLGQRRAEAVRARLQLLGVKDAQMEAVSYGEERPRSPGPGETAWAENRRADVVYR